jgi:serine protease
MKKLILTSLVALAVLAPGALALRDLSLRQQGELPRDQFVDLVDPANFRLDLLVVQFVEDTRIRLRDGELVSLEGRSTGALDAFLKARPQLKVERLFPSMGEEELDAYVAQGEQRSGWDVADLNNFYLFRVEGGNRDAQGLLRDLLKLDLVQTCYYEPIGQPATCNVDPSPATPIWEANQDYREAAPTGLDIQFAWDFNPTYGNGVSSYWFQDLEWGWCEDHEDFPASFSIRNGADSTDPDFYNHGTAVMGIMGACDDYKGVTGLVPDVQLTARVVSNHASYADALIAIGSDLVLGETYLIEIHAPGPSQGTTCVCNCGQFEFIAIEYWTANFNAILANSTNGRFCIEAAGNGSMDLDWGGYGGAFNLGVRDSQAIIVGAGDGGSVHNPECWTNHGTRISAYGWGSGVYTTGYGTLFNQTGCQQDYDNDFGGTSSASPIVAGAAVSLALIHNNQFGSYPSPVTLRSRLTTNGTAQGPTDPWKEISVLPNMKGILAPDLRTHLYGDWAANIVPSDVMGTHSLPAALPPTPSTTYMDWAWINSSHYGAATPARAYLYADDSYIIYAFNATLNPNTSSSYSDYGVQMRGGLHYLRNTLDADLLVDESVETNNTQVIGYRWEPVALASNVPQTFTRGPRKSPEGYSHFALDGYGNGGAWPGYWDITAVMPAVGADYDLFLYNTDPTPTSGWDSSVAWSGNVGSTDFVGCNNNMVSDGDWVGVVNWNDSSEGYTMERQGSIYLGSPPAVQALVAIDALDAGEILDVWEFNATAGSPVWLNFVVTAGTADISVLVYGPAETYFIRNDALLSLNAGGPGVGESGIFTPAANGFHCIVVCKGQVSDLAQQADYNFYWGVPTGDLTTVARAGWTAPVVARNSGGSVGVLPAVLNEGPSVGDAGVANIGVGTMPAGPNLAFHLDGPFVYSSGDFSALIPGYEGEISNRGIGTVKGGRHELGAVQDYLGEFQEQLPGGEGNNRHYAQYAWSPYILANLTPLSRGAAPNWRNADNPEGWSLPGFNQDGYRITASYWTGFAAMPTLATEQLNSWIYNDALTGPTTAFIGPEESNFPAPGKISIAMANGNMIGNGINRNVGVCNNFTYPTVVPSTPYTVQMAQRLQDLITGTITNNSLAAGAGGGQLLHTFDVYMVAGQSYPVNLFNHSTINLGAAIFRAGVSYQGLDDAVAVFNANGAGGHESGEFTAAITGWHGVAVYRDGYLDLGPAAPYGIVVGTWRPAAITDLAITPIDFSPGYATVHMTFTPVTTDMNGNPLTVDHYTLYTVEANGYDFSTPWVEVLSTTYNDGEGPLYFGNIGWTTSAYLNLVAVDTDGLIVASSVPLPWTRESEIPGFGVEPRLSVPAAGPVPTR